jgi:hypothetical protein
MTESLAEATGFVPPRRWWRRLVYLGLFIGPGLALFAIGIWYSYDVRSDRALQEAIAEADRLDPGWRLDEIEAKRANVPDAENSALCVLKVRKLMESSQSGESAKALEKAFSLSEDISGLPPEAQLSAAQTSELRAILDKMAAALEEARRLKDLPAGRYDVRWSYWAAETLLASQHAREARQLLQMDTGLKSQDGRADGALDSVLAILNASRSVGDEPSIISQLIRMSCQSTAVHVCERALAQGTPSDAALIMIQNVFLKETEDPLMLYATRGERAHFHRLAKAVRSGETSLATAASAAAPTPGGGSGSSVLAGFAERIIMRQNHAPGLHLLTQLVEIAKLPVEQQCAEIKKLQPIVASIPSLVGPELRAHEKVFQAFARTQAMLRTAAVGIAVERYRLSKTKWPGTLAEVVDTGFIQVIPIDPYDGAPLRYRRLKDGIVVYCVGPDGKDDGGLINRKGDPTKAGYDLGFQLWDVDKRRQPPPPKAKNDDETEPQSDKNPAKQ